MWIANEWTAYEVLDTGDREKLERWGQYLLVRPDPQVLWKTDRRHPGWKRQSAGFPRSRRGGENGDLFDLPQVWQIGYKGLSFRLQPFAFKHTGLFPEQAVNWDWFSALIRDRLAKQPDRPVRVLNLFAYTGGATLAAAQAGAQVTHVDAAKGMVAWAKENAAASGLSEAPIRWLVDDCRKFV